MNKKKHNGDSNGDESTESCDENQNTVECTHIKRSVDLPNIKRNISKNGFLKDCADCQSQPFDTDADGDIEYDQALWLCLKCGHQACGRGKNKHALKHYNTPRSDSHVMCVNTTIWTVWCYECDEEVKVTCKKRLLETVEYLKKEAEAEKRDDPPSVHDYGGYNVSAVPGDQRKGSTFPRARGMTNLGNTCFFNSVMQCLGQTPYLLSLLMETEEAGQYFRLPGGTCPLDGKETIELEPLDGMLSKWKPLCKALAEALEALSNGRSEVYHPNNIHSRVTMRLPQFGGGDQHDSHELLRHLLEAVREEDLKRYKCVILSKLGLDSKTTDPSTVEGDKKKIIKFYGQQASEMLLPTEQVFRGVLVSTLQCQTCGHTSHRDEFFLDLSLPISESQVPPVLRRKADDSDDIKPSKHQIKKEKRAERKKNKKQKGARTKGFGQPMSIDDESRMDNKSDSESDADVEDNTEENSNTNIQGEDNPKGTESGYNSDKADKSSPDSNNACRGTSPEMRVDDSGVPSPVVGSTALSVSPISPVNSASSSETNVDMGSPSCGHNSPNEDVTEEFERPESRLAFVNNKNSDLKCDLEKLSLLNEADASKSSLYSQDDEMEGACGGIEVVEDEKMEDDDDDDVSAWTETMAPRYQCEEGECSVQSCLNQFTECELMAGSNKVGCDLCTQRHGGPQKKTVYTEASKQLLIYNPPAVLILHLKRFQVCRYRSVKVVKFVKFSPLLDLSPFCSKRAKNLPSFEQGQSKILYSLYGVVEHSGSIHGGHYVAYVKTRQKLEDDSYRWNFLPKNQQKAFDAATKGAQGEPQVPPGKWYYISDSYVSEVAETKVLSSQAYLLFYERIL